MGIKVGAGSVCDDGWIILESTKPAYQKDHNGCPFKESN